MDVENNRVAFPVSRQSRRDTAPKGRRWAAQAERYSANPGNTGGCNSFLMPDATGRGHTVVRSRPRTARTSPCSRRSRPFSCDGSASASGVRHDDMRTKFPVPRVRGVPLTRLPNVAPSGLCAGDFDARLGRKRFSYGTFYDANRRSRRERFALYSVLQRKKASR